MTNASIRFPDGRVPLLISADSEELVAAEASALAAYLAARPDADVEHVSAELFRVRRIRRYQRLVLADDAASASEALRACASGDSHPALVRSTGRAVERKIGLVFPGQGSQRPGMGRGYYAASSDFRVAVDECNAIFGELFGISPLDYLLDETAPNDIAIVQPALFLQTIGLTAMWRGSGVPIAATIGHSQGEIPAAATAGVISMRDAVRVVATRARLVAGIEREGSMGGPHAMAVIGLDRDGTEAAIARCSGWAELAVVNSPNIHAISGDLEAVAEIVQSLNSSGVFAKQIRVDYPAHTSLLREFRDDFLVGLLDDLDSNEFAESDIACYGGTLGSRLTPELAPVEYWYWNLRNRVRFDQAVLAAAADGVNTFIEVSENPTMMLALQDILRGAADTRFIGTGRRDEPELAEFSKNLATAVVGDGRFDWRSRVPERTAPPLFDLPPSQMQRKRLWAGRPAMQPATGSIAVPTARVAAPATRTRSDEYAPQALVERWEAVVGREITGPRNIAVLAPDGLSDARAQSIGAAAARMGATVVEPAVADTVLVIAPDGGDDLQSAIAATGEFLADSAWVGELPETGEIWLVTEGAEPTEPGEAVDMAHAAMASGFRCLAADHPRLRFRHLDIARGLPAPDWAQRVVDGAHTVGEPEIAWRADGFTTKRLVVQEKSSTPSTVDLADVLILGGTGALGMDVAEEFAGRGAGRITLVSRSGGDAETAARIAALVSAGAAIEVWRGDVTDPAVVDGLARRYVDAAPTLIVHATVDYGASESAADDASAFIAAAAVKVTALDSIASRLVGPSTKLLLCSSLSASIGGRGHRAYAASNRMLDALASNWRRQGIDAVAVQWGLWRSVGAQNDDAVQQIAASGLLPMDPGSAVQAALDGGSDNRLVVAADWPRLGQLLSLIGTGALLRGLGLPASPLSVSAPVDDAVPAAPPAEQLDATSTSPSGDLPTHVRTVLADVMGLGRDDHVDAGVPLVSLGLDSVQALDLRQRLEADLRTEIPITAMLSGATLDDLLELVDA
jgi:mycobactin polyketide synthetase MbtD